MEFVFCLISGLLYSFTVMSIIIFVIILTYGIIRFSFWIFEMLEITNPMIVFLEKFLKIFGGCMDGK